MTGRTHLSVGTAAALAAARPDSLSALCLCAAAGAVGSLICDVDVDSSGSHRGVARLTAVLLLSVGLLALVEYLWQPGLVARLQAQTSLTRVLPGTLSFLTLCWFGMQQPHRSFMHSFLGLFLMTLLAGAIAPGFALPFGVAMLSHILLDLLNHRRVRLLYPLPQGLSLGLCRASGWVDGLLCGLGGAALMVEGVRFFFTFFW